MSITRMIVLFFIFLFSKNTFPEDPMKDKYENYVFSPEYGINVRSNEIDLHKEGYEKYLLDLQSPRDLFSLDLESSEALFIRVNTTNSYEFMKRSDEIYQKTGRRELSTWDGVILHNDNFNQLLIKERNLLPLGRGGYDYYGCLDENPLFKTNFIGDIEKDELFVITGDGHHTDNMRGAGVRDHLMLHVYGGEQYAKLFEVMLLAVNYLPWNPDNPPKNYYFPQSEYSSKKIRIEGQEGEGRKLYSKLFFHDFNENNRMDVLIWQAEYKSRKITADKKPGFDLVSNNFFWYEEDDRGNGVEKKLISIKQAREWLENKNLTWENGWPSESLCVGSKKELPIMVGVDDPELEVLELN